MQQELKLLLQLFATDNQAVITVSDKGSGISSDNVAKIVKRYERVDVSSHFGSFGMDLYISKQIVDTHQ